MRPLSSLQIQRPKLQAASLMARLFFMRASRDYQLKKRKRPVQKFSPRNRKPNVGLLPPKA